MRGQRKGVRSFVITFNIAALVWIPAFAGMTNFFSFFLGMAGIRCVLCLQPPFLLCELL
jgi:hypothetical protein